MRDIKESILTSIGQGNNYFKPMIETWLNNHKSVFRDYTLRDDLRIDIDSDVSYTEEIPNYIVFGKVKGFTLSGWKGENKDLGKIMPEYCTSLTIYDCPNIKDFSSVKEDITNVSGFVSLYKLKSLTSLEGVEHLMDRMGNRMNTLKLVDCGKLKDLSGGDLSDVNVLFIKDCDRFQSLIGTGGVQDITVVDCKNFSSLEGIDNQTIRTLDIVGCKNLNSVEPLKKSPLRSIMLLKIKDCGESITADNVHKGLETNKGRVKIIV